MIQLVDAQAMAKNFPENFKVPKQEDLNSIKVGDSVKVCVNNEERLWVEITEISNSQLKGRIDNYPIKLEEVSFGDKIIFKKENVYDIFN